MTTFLLDPGHGIDTAGKRSPLVPPGIYEWEFNRDIARRLCERGPAYGLRVHNLVPELASITLEERVSRANRIYEDDRDVVFVSVHANAFGDGNNWDETAEGVATFVYQSCSKDSRRLAQSLVEEVAEMGVFRNRGVREGSFYVLKKTAMPAVLVESGFMTNSGEATKLSNEYWRRQIALGYVKAFQRFLEVN
jgi:N-acetylmuramoyl-L-alanine amidase